MAAANPAESLRDEASCSICLDYFTDPVTIDCGHNFCRSCITQSWEGRDRNFPCPQCRETSQQRNLRPNRHLANMTEMVKKLSQCSVRPKEENLCEEHEEKLKLFCEEDQKIICLICRESRDHRSHTVSPIKEAVQEYKEKFKVHLEPLRKDLEDLLKFKSTEGKKAEELKEKLEMHLEPLRKDLEDLLKFKSTEGRKAEELKDVKEALKRCQKMKFPKPEAVSTDLKMDFQLSFPQQLKTWITKFGVNVTLDPETARPDLVLSEDGKSVRRGNTGQNVPDTPQRFDCGPCVLGSEGFTSGRRYWEVEVGDVSYWTLGVCKDSVRRKGKITLAPEEGFWTVKLWYEQGCGTAVAVGYTKFYPDLSDSGLLWNKQRCSALTSPETQLPLRKRLWAVGILLDYEAGKVSFYDADNKYHLFTFTDTFTGKLRPFFWTNSEIPLRIRQLPAWN
ncbi:E3 ubiquitin-protein ligase TRIM39-like isoform X2 [Microcaecilia unicolor]|uniref:RING-type E3 ubiquitin transferase n=1 Tax=Microcaecilia unicolor TaxID=1415580 RepID=A0A6P7XTB3_9AMPH|nr:E3 ubiquitin-protein ligase TRIM39-like isoform X2 [Microcaecilia unicolor]